MVRVAHAGLFLFAAIDAVLLEVPLTFVFGQLVYEFCRLGYLRRFEHHRAASRRELEELYDRPHPPAVTILVPAYCEHPDVVRMTLMAAALMEYPNRRVALLIDDPPDSSGSPTGFLARNRELTRDIDARLMLESRKYGEQLAAFQHRFATSSLDLRRECEGIAVLYQTVAQWFEGQAAAFSVRDHFEALFVKEVLLDPALKHRERAQWFSAMAGSGAPSCAEILREYRRLAGLFAARVTSFERKRIVNLSHVANKAMNLNSYIGLLGRSFRVVDRPEGRTLEDCPPDRSDLTVPHADYVVVVDADTIVAGDYAMRLVHELERPAHRRIAAAQAPHSPAPESPIPLQRAAGGQSDLQRLMCQGSTYYGASFWLGANSMLRLEALKDISETSYERGYPITRYIKDRTAVEDTESTLDLRKRGWQIFNYPDVMAHSAEPRDFGSLIIQRHRWAGGGIVNFPKLVRLLWTGTEDGMRLSEALLRINYILGTCLNLGILVVPLVALRSGFRGTGIVWALSILPYNLLFARDLFMCGYRFRDLPRVFALGLLLVPVNLAGIGSALWTRFRGRRQFSRTPKVAERTSARAFYIMSPLLMLLAMLYAMVRNLQHQMWTFGFLSGLNLALLSYAFLRFVGIREAWQDVVADLSGRMPSFAAGGNGASLRAFPSPRMNETSTGEKVI